MSKVNRRRFLFGAAAAGCAVMGGKLLAEDRFTDRLPLVVPDRLPSIDILQSFQKQLAQTPRGNPLLFYGILKQPDGFELRSIRYSELWTLRLRPASHPQWRTISLPLFV